MAVTALNNSTLADINGTKTTTTANEAGSADRFLKLLVAQMQNQDPLSPMDNAQVTSQMAQISSVTGIEKLNATVQGLSGQFVQMQALQGAAIIGKDVVVPGNKMNMQDGVGQGGFELDSAADSVKVEVLNAAGHVIDTMNLGAQGAGVQSFDWKPSASVKEAGATFRVSATNGGTKLAPTALMRDTVTAVSTSGNQLVLELKKAGNVPYNDVRELS